MRCRSADGEWQVDVIRLIATGAHRDGAWLRIRRWGCHIADVRTVDEQEYVDLADLQEGLGTHRWPEVVLDHDLASLHDRVPEDWHCGVRAAAEVVAARCPWRSSSASQPKTAGPVHAPHVVVLFRAKATLINEARRTA